MYFHSRILKTIAHIINPSASKRGGNLRIQHPGYKDRRECSIHPVVEIALFVCEHCHEGDFILILVRMISLNAALKFC
jgi:hypothetical protein